MAEQGETQAQAQRAGWWIWIGCFTAVALILTLTPGALNLRAFAGIEFKTPDFAPLWRMSLLVQFHVATVALALVLGPVQFILPKGGAAHRIIGWVYVLSMFSTAVATLFIRDMRDGQFSGIHLFSLMALIFLPLAVWHAKRGNIRAHTRSMIGLYIGLCIAGVTAIAPGRLLWEMFFR